MAGLIVLLVVVAQLQLTILGKATTLNEKIDRIETEYEHPSRLSVRASGDYSTTIGSTDGR